MNALCYVITFDECHNTRDDLFFITVCSQCTRHLPGLQWNKKKTVWSSQKTPTISFYYLLNSVPCCYWLWTVWWPVLLDSAEFKLQFMVTVKSCRLGGSYRLNWICVVFENTGRIAIHDRHDGWRPIPGQPNTRKKPFWFDHKFDLAVAGNDSGRKK